jgi:hypothetical protein
LGAVASGVGKFQAIVVPHHAGDSSALVEVFEVRATAKRYMLAVVNAFAAGKNVRSGSPA